MIQPSSQIGWQRPETGQDHIDGDGRQGHAHQVARVPTGGIVFCFPFAAMVRATLVCPLLYAQRAWQHDHAIRNPEIVRRYPKECQDMDVGTHRNCAHDTDVDGCFQGAMSLYRGRGVIGDVQQNRQVGDRAHNCKKRAKKFDCKGKNHGWLRKNPRSELIPAHLVTGRSDQVPRDGARAA